MIRAAAIGLFAAAVIAAGCSSDRADVRESPWTRIAATLRPGLDPASPNPCNGGQRRCIDAVIAEMSRRLDGLAACDHHGPFALMYLRVTEAVREDGADLDDTERAYVSHLDAVFAQLYFEAFDGWAEGRDESLPAAWRVAFDAAERRRVSGIGNLLLGMNAHISRDLPYAVAAIGTATKIDEKRSFDGVNVVLGRVAEPMLAEAAERFDPTIAAFRLPVLEIDQRTVSSLLGRWRDDAFRDAQRLLEAETAGSRAAVEASIEDKAAWRAALVVAATSRVSFSDAGKARDRHCERQAPD